MGFVSYDLRKLAWISRAGSEARRPTESQEDQEWDDVDRFPADLISAEESPAFLQKLAEARWGLLADEAAVLVEAAMNDEPCPTVALRRGFSATQSRNLLADIRNRILRRNLLKHRAIRIKTLYS